MKRAARDAERQRKQNEKLQVLAEAEATVAAFNEYIEQITGLHKERLGAPVDWVQHAEAPAPKETVSIKRYEPDARFALEIFKPNFVQRLLNTADKKREKLKRSLKEAGSKDDENQKKIQESFQKEFANWEKEKTLAGRILRNDGEAYLEAIESRSSIDKIDDLGSYVSFKITENGDLVSSINVHSDDVIPSEKYSLRQSGSLSARQMPKTEFNELYQDYVCSVILRIASEIFALLPIERLLVNAVDDLLNSKTGHIEEQMILSVAVMRKTFKDLKLSDVDPSEAMDNFVHNMNFKRTQGFAIVAPVNIEELC